MGEVVDELVADKDDITGVILTSAKKTFFAGGDLDTLSLGQAGRRAAGRSRTSTEVKAQLRRLETLGSPVVAAMNGTALGGGLEIGAGLPPPDRRSTPKGVFYGLPEVTLGLLPGGGGVTRITRLLGIADGVHERPRAGPAAQAGRGAGARPRPRARGHARGDARPRRTAWIAANPDAAQPWDKPGYKIPGGTPSNPKLAAILPAFPANLRKQLKGAPDARRRATSSPRPSRARRSTSTPRCASRAATSPSWSPARSRRT